MRTNPAKTPKIVDNIIGSFAVVCWVMSGLLVGVGCGHRGVVGCGRRGVVGCGRRGVVGCGRRGVVGCGRRGVVGCGRRGVVGCGHREVIGGPSISNFLEDNKTMHHI